MKRAFQPRLNAPACCLLYLALCGLPVNGEAESQEAYRARLTASPVDFRNNDRIQGSGQVQAVLEDNRLQIRGEFQGLVGPATKAALHGGHRAVPGPAVALLRVSPARRGEISGAVTLDAEQMERLHEEGLYVQIHSEAAPAGNLRGWLLKGGGDS